MSNSGVMLRRSSSSSSYEEEEEEEEVNRASPPIMRPNPRRYRPQRPSSPSSPSTTTTTSNSNSPPPRTRIRKPNPKFLSFLLQALIMIFVITVFFLFMGFAAIFLLHLCIAGRTIHRLRHRTPTFHYSSVQDDDYLGGGGGVAASGSGALSPLDLQRIPAFNYLTLVDTTSATDCVVCLETFSQGQTFRLLPSCKHAFHASCIDAWFTRASACPICRTVVEFDH